MTGVVFIRYGLTLRNLEKREMGHLDILLFEKDEEQTSRLADRLASIKFTQLYSSDFVNHLNLSEIRATLGNVAVIELPGTGITWT